jgi:hypothetical protein
MFGSEVAVPDKVLLFGSSCATNCATHDRNGLHYTDVLVFRKGRFVIRRAGESLEEPSRVGDERAAQSSRSRNSSDSSPSFVSVDSNSKVVGGRRPV